ncbi:hypothetical protein BN133_2980 [Cronobacter dublinensis 582]|nr:hypothetical protein BN133_2980 [Cronobacter dublinensis 582]
MQNSVNGALAGARGHLQRDEPVNAGGACRDVIARLMLNGERFAGQRALIETRSSGKQPAVCREPPACGHFNHIAGLKRAYRDRFTGVAAQTHRTQRPRHNGRGIKAAETVNKTLNRRALRFRLFNQMQNSVNGALAGARGHLQRDEPVNAGGACRDVIARLMLNGERFAGQRALIETRSSGKQPAVCREPPACGHFNHIAK